MELKMDWRILTFRIKKSSHTIFPLRHIECIFKTISCNSWTDWTPVNQVRSENKITVITHSAFHQTTISHTYSCLTSICMNLLGVNLRINVHKHFTKTKPVTYKRWHDSFKGGGMMLIKYLYHLLNLGRDHLSISEQSFWGLTRHLSQGTQKHRLSIH